MDTDENIRIFWKLKRDMKKRGYTKEKVYQQILDRKNDFEKYILPQKEKADIIISYYSNYIFKIDSYNHMGLALLFLSTGFKIIEIGQWGNYDYINKLFRIHGWPDATQVSHTNEEKNVAQCWILAKKP